MAEEKKPSESTHGDYHTPEIFKNYNNINFQNTSLVNKIENFNDANHISSNSNQPKILIYNLSNNNSSNILRIFKGEKEEKIIASESLSEKSILSNNKNPQNIYNNPSNSNRNDKLLSIKPNETSKFLNIESNSKNNNNNNNMNNNLTSLEKKINSLLFSKYIHTQVDNAINSSEKSFSQNISINKPRPKSSKSLLKSCLSSSVAKTDRSAFFGERLFYKGLMIEEKKVKKAEIIKKSMQQELDKTCTFKPKLNQNSLAITMKTNYIKLKINNGNDVATSSTPNLFISSHKEADDPRLKSPDNFYNSRTEASENIFSNIRENLNINIKNNFQSNRNNNNKNNTSVLKNQTSTASKQPPLAHTSILNTENNVNYNCNNGHIFANKSVVKTEAEINITSKRLYDTAAKYRNKKLELKEKLYSELCTFSPKIKRNDNQIPNIDNFFERLQNWVEKRNERCGLDQENVYYDQETGKRLFSPQINQSRKHKV